MAPPLKRQVLVVDDDRSVRNSVAMLLEAEGYNVTAAEDGFGALLQLRKAMPDVIVSDLTCRECLVSSSSHWFAVASRGSS